MDRFYFLKQYDHVAELQAHSANTKDFPVILIVLDTLRKRSLDEHPDIFKNLTAFARESLVFESCVANSSWTLPSHASMFTGLSPREHGAHFNLESAPWFDGFPTPRPLHDKFITLAEVFAGRQYPTAFISANFAALNPGFGLNQGFNVYDLDKGIGSAYTSLPFKPLVHVLAFLTNIQNKYAVPYRKAEDINTAVEHLLRRFPTGAFFLVLNYMDSHVPYMPTNRFKRLFLGWKETYENVFLQLTNRFLYRFTGKQKCSLDESLYKGEMAYLDHHLGNLFEQLKLKGLYDDALIILTSDHGELFCRHGYSGHQTPLYEGVTRVPLFVKFPRQEVTGIEKHYITLADLYPTILNICGLPYDQTISGKPFGKPAGQVVAEFYNYDVGVLRALYDGSYKYMKFEKGKPNALYDVKADPLEQKNLADDYPEKVAEMETKLAEWIGMHPPRYEEEALKEMNAEPPQKLRDDLRSLGYIQ